MDTSALDKFISDLTSKIVEIDTHINLVEAKLVSMGLKIYYLHYYCELVECQYNSANFNLEFSKEEAINVDPQLNHQFDIRFEEYEGVFRLTYIIYEENHESCHRECMDSKSKLLINAPANIKCILGVNGLNEFVDEYQMNAKRLLLEIDKNKD